MTLTDQFNMTDPDFFKDIHDNEQALEAVRKIEERRLEIAKKLEAHCQKHLAQWTVREATRLHAKQELQMRYEVPKPRNSTTHQLLWNHHMLQARKIVDLRIEERQLVLNSIARRMQSNAVAMTENQKYQDLARQKLDRDITDINQNIHQQRMTLYRDFEDNKIQRVEDARTNLSATPEKYVFEAYKQQDQELLEQKEHLLTLYVVRQIWTVDCLKQEMV